MPKVTAHRDHLLFSSGIIMVTGTDTGVGKTIVSAAVAASLSYQGVDVHIHKPVQTGLIAAADPRRAALEREYNDVVTRGDAQLAGELAGCSYSTGVSVELPMAPTAAAIQAGQLLPTVVQSSRRIHRLLQRHEVVVVEGAGGLLVDLGGHTLADLALELQQEFQVPVLSIVVVRAQLGTLNHTALTMEALSQRNLKQSSVVVGSWPAQPSAVELSNCEQLARNYPLLGLIPQHSAGLIPSVFQAKAPRWLGAYAAA